MRHGVTIKEGNRRQTKGNITIRMKPKTINLDVKVINIFSFFFVFFCGTSSLYSTVRERTGKTCSKGSYRPGVKPATVAVAQLVERVVPLL